MNNNDKIKPWFVSIAVCFSVIGVVLLAYLFIYLIVKRWNKIPTKTFPRDINSAHKTTRISGYAVQPGDIVVRPLLGIGILPNLFHMGVVSEDGKHVYHRTIMRFSKTTFSNFLNLRHWFFVLHFPADWYRPLTDSLKFLDDLVERERSVKPRGFFYDFNLLTNNCEAKILPLRLFQDVASCFLYKSLQMENLFCKFRRISKACSSTTHLRCTEENIYLTRHNVKELREI